MSEIETLIQKLVEEKTFSLEAAPRIAAIKEQAEKLAKQVESLGRDKKEYADRITSLELTRSKMEATIKEWAKREEDLLAREAKVTDLEKQVAVAQASLNATMATMGMFLKNTVVRENVTRNHVIPPLQQGYSPTYHTVTDTITKETE